MPFAYYHKLSRKQQRIYDKSDQITFLVLKDLVRLQQLIRELERLLPEGRSAVVQRICQQISNCITSEFDVPRVKVKVLASRPSNEYYELHGYYEPAYEDKNHTISVWMKTATRKQVVAFKTFLRTLIHELCHHLDYEYLAWMSPIIPRVFISASPAFLSKWLNSKYLFVVEGLFTQYHPDSVRQ